MSAIDITTMRGEMPRAVPHLLPEQAATVAKNCHFRHGVITPIMADVDGVKTFSLKPTTIFRYRDYYADPGNPVFRNDRSGGLAGRSRALDWANLPDQPLPDYRPRDLFQSAEY